MVSNARDDLPEPETLYEAVKAAYGENYLPNVRLTDEEIEKLRNSYNILKGSYEGLNM